jgi:hypothetical protein
MDLDSGLGTAGFEEREPTVLLAMAMGAYGE